MFLSPEALLFVVLAVLAPALSRRTLFERMFGDNEAADTDQKDEEDA